MDTWGSADVPEGGLADHHKSALDAELPRAQPQIVVLPHKETRGNLVVHTPRLEELSVEQWLHPTSSPLSMTGGKPEVIENHLQLLFRRYAEEDRKTTWMGVYLRKGPILVLGPFVGKPTVHEFIPVSRGVVGKCAEAREPLVIGDVTSCSYYLECCPEVCSEVVVPIPTDNEEIVGVLDLDSEKVNSYGDSDVASLQRVASAIKSHCRLLAEKLQIRVTYGS